MASMYSNLVLSVFLLLYSACQAQPEAYIITTIQNQTIKSEGFPLKCCTEASYLLTCDTGTTQCYVRMEFSDLDLPVGSTLTLYDGKSTNADLHAYQPELISDGVNRLQWLRKTISSSGDSLLLVFTPPERQGFGHVGFKFKAWTTEQSPDNWDYYATSDDCPLLRYTMDGGQVYVGKLAPKSDLYSVTQFDCVWQIKMPTEFEGLDDYFVYVRFNNLTFDTEKKGHLFVLNEGISSEGPSLVPSNVMSLSDLNKPDNMLKSDKGLYVRVRMYESSEVSVMNFVYGFAKADTSTGESCSFASLIGFKCQSSDVCVPISNKCDRVANCVDASDERREECKALLTTTTPLPTTTTTTRKPTTTPSCRWYEQRCPDGRCIDDDDHCGCKSYEKYCSDSKKCINKYSTCPRTCASYERKCNDGTCSYNGECPEDGCNSWEFTCDSGQCITDSYKCDGGDDCWDSSDEDGCPLSSKAMFGLIIGGVGCLIVTVVGCVYKYAKPMDASTASNRSTGLTANSAFNRTADRPAAVAGAAPPATNYNTTLRYTPVNQGGSPSASITRIPDAPEPEPEPSAPPPPAYSDVMTEPHQYPAPEGGLPPPPAYETVSHIKSSGPSAPPSGMV